MFLYFFLRKEVIQPHLPIRLPCYDFTPVIGPAFGSSFLTVRSLTSGVTDSHGVTGGAYPFALDGAVEFIQRFLERIARSHPLYHPAARPQDLYSDVEHFIPKTLTCGEGWLMAGEIAHYAHQGVRSFIILQPFGCLPNHVCGRGVTKRLKEEFPGVQLLPLDLDPDTSYANVENRLQMLIMNQTAEAEHSAASVEPAPQKTRGGSPRPALSST